MPSMETEFSGPPKKRMIVPITSIFILLAVLIAAWLVYEIYLPHTSFFSEKRIEIPPGFGSRKIGALLRDQGFIESKWAFVIYATFRGQASALKPGTYAFSENTAMREILENLVTGEKYPNERFLVIPEGWSLRDIGEYLEEQGVVARKEDFWRVAGYPATDYGARKDIPPPKDFSKQFTFLREASARVGLEGFLYPDTYRVYRTASVDDIIVRMLENFERKVAKSEIAETARRSSTNWSLYRTLILASMIEKEVTSDEDRALVAGILQKRLKLGMPLQVDATLVYARGHNTTPLSAGDKTLDSAFNTYRYKGLPLGPISNPGYSAIFAVLNPAQSPYLYYLSAPDGKTIFSRTLEEHNRAIAAYLK